ncbi:hypothetical protein FB45DRAFT_938773 [Roridomyces roridus]|uniref:F-box domain-containing protein n=1 Tax=Roridomyces roridus TaxID=1738132 RepID=A0AAD7B7F8_9AGAR|nr:hypothetical protein FB45DRAFT_938773 [Roridomyces roridus]
MPSEEQVRARIETLTAAIEQQKQVLKDLEEQRCAAQSELNTIIAPIARLPVEISTDILLQSLPTPGTWAAVTELERVCRQWRAIVLCTPIFWTSINDEGIPPPAFPDILATWLERGQELPVSLVLQDADLSMFTYKAAGIQEYAFRVRNLELRGVGDQELRAIAFDFPVLSSLTLAETNCSPKVLLEVLHGAPNLANLNVLEGCSLSWDPHPVPMTHLNIQSLRCEGADTLDLDYLTLPSLRLLSISQCDEFGMNDLRRFLTRSNPPLRFLHMGVQAVDKVEWIVPSLKLVPGLLDFEVQLCGSPVTFFDLFRNDHDLLPELRSIVLDARDHHVLPSGYQGMMDFLYHRRELLRSLRMLIPKKEEAFFLANADVREFQERGMHIHIGTEDRNFVPDL